ncbi:GNAT family N-acetyltransferase [Phytohabitans houttuyneae]|uniref:N-acetyltransferase n=1 Tax=Phytohabitans houttuyneae TaxID=1076126 RepID=A0A6V8KU30_9ACTN|nr:GNAT family N-acetyltransferase [Phytohabitans houttuyneae]GFJ86198.1 N-acetyltransferase [Phytohabitans houttuyneae]
MAVTARKATAADATAMGELRWRWPTEESGYKGTDRTEWVATFAAWVVDHARTHIPFVAEVSGQVVGMAWLMLADRVPAPTHRHRRTGDVQAVYVAPEHRDSGVGAVLLEALLTEARTLGLEHVTVHSSRRAVRFYERGGFDPDPTWLRWLPA